MKKRTCLNVDCPERTGGECTATALTLDDLHQIAQAAEGSMEKRQALINRVEERPDATITDIESVIIRSLTTPQPIAGSVTAVVDMRKLRSLINQYGNARELEGRIDELEALHQSSTVAPSPLFNPLSGVGRLDVWERIAELKAKQESK